MLTRPKLILPFQIARIQMRFASRGVFACLLRRRLMPEMISGRFTETARGRLRPGVARSIAATALRGDLELLARDTAELKQANQRFFDQVVRAGGARGDADHDRTRW